MYRGHRSHEKCMEAESQFPELCWPVQNQSYLSEWAWIRIRNEIQPKKPSRSSDTSISLS